MTQLLTTAIRITINSATLIDRVFHTHFFEDPDCGIVDTDLTELCGTFVKLPFCCKIYDDTATKHKVFAFIYKENARQA